MLNQTGVKTASYGMHSSFIVDDRNSTSFSCMVTDANAVVVDGKKMLRMGTPLSGDLTARETPFEAASSGANAVGLLVHDVEVTNGTANAQVMVFGFADISKVHPDVATMIRSAAPNLKMIQIVK